MPSTNIVMNAVHLSEELEKEVSIQLSLPEKAVGALFAVSEHFETLAVVPKGVESLVYAVGGTPGVHEIETEDGELCGKISEIKPSDNGLDIYVDVGVWLSAWKPDLSDTMGAAFVSEHGTVVFNIPFPKNLD